MVRCAMCDSPATNYYDVEGYGILSVCGDHYLVLIKNDEYKIGINKEKIQEILTRILDALNTHYTDVESYMGMPPMKRGKNMGKREGLKIAIGEVEKEMEALLK